MNAGTRFIAVHTKSLTVLTLGAVALADWLFYRHPVGWTLGLFAWALLLLTVLRGPRALRSGPAWVLLILLHGLVLALIDQPGTLNVLLTVAGLGAVALCARWGWKPDARVWLGRGILFFGIGWTQVLRDLATARRWRNRGTPAKRGSVLGRWLLPVTLSLVFVLLFAAANPIISSWLKQALDAFDMFQLRAARVVLWLVVFVWCWALCRFRPVKTMTTSRARATAAGQVHSPGVLSTEMVIRCLVLFNLVFAVQNGLDIRYLWGGAALPAGMTYAQYAHRGAYPLVATALLAAAFMLITFGPGGAAEKSRTARAWVYAWVAQNVFLTLAAAWRLHLYIEVYSLTKLRLAACVWMLLVALGLAWICLRIILKRPNLWLLHANVLTLFVVLYAAAFVDWAGFIARYNARHCWEMTGSGANLDLRYMRQLGPASLPALVWLAQQPLAPDRVDPDWPGNLRELECDLREELDAPLRDWRGWTLHRQRLRDRIGPAPELP
ncbi:MAG: hypothetical protein A3K19_19955 [Lentisphaerae bacterium RIFOXYB12_FULL_65_16]|nr:MAG: hypothetical protein A3K18_07235 [Lentisphaerae bacterium RIFOXYA12_64_32]OGV85084.1 MAG: hypothetical protein A3K19_19955 [Lentisphaerae bacterium RIFOXYB12_FULL_65_16]